MAKKKPNTPAAPKNTFDVEWLNAPTWSEDTDQVGNDGYFELILGTFSLLVDKTTFRIDLLDNCGEVLAHREGERSVDAAKKAAKALAWEYLVLRQRAIEAVDVREGAAK